MNKTVDLIFDCASPNAYLIYNPLKDVIERTGSRLNIIPCLLGGIFRGTGNQAPMITNANIKNKSDYERLEFMRFIKKHDLSEFQFNPHFPLNTLMAMRGAIYAQMNGTLETYVPALLHHMWVEPKKMDDPEVFVAALDSSGIDGRQVLEATQDPVVKAKLIENTETAVERGAFGIPTYFVGNEMYFGKERLGQLEEILSGDDA